jgi:hypothetical protein
MNARWLFVYSALLVLFANGAFADEGTYERTKDGKTLVWNSYPLEGETVEWTGDRDKEGYASGYGTVTWYKLVRSGYTFDKGKHRALSGRYSGKMVRGKLEGSVVKESRGSLIRFSPGTKTTLATFVNGDRTTDWRVGTAPNPNSTITTSVTENPSPATIAPDQKHDVPALGPAKPKVSALAKEATKKTDDSVQSVAAPPPSLHTNPPAEESPQESAPPDAFSSAPTAATLTAPDAIQFADAEARANGYDLRKYQNPRANYVADGDVWSVSYDEKHIDGRTSNDKRFNVIVEDKTRKTTLTKGR